MNVLSDLQVPSSCEDADVDTEAGVGATDEDALYLMEYFCSALNKNILFLYKTY